jgi:hypothetical protein
MNEPQIEKDQTLGLYRLVGQSNMSGRGGVERQDRQTYPRVCAQVGLIPSSTGWVLKGDGMHFDAASARELGRRYGAEMQRIQGQ